MLFGLIIGKFHLHSGSRNSGSPLRLLPDPISRLGYSVNTAHLVFAETSRLALNSSLVIVPYVNTTHHSHTVAYSFRVVKRDHRNFGCKTSLNKLTMLVVFKFFSECSLIAQPNTVSIGNRAPVNFFLCYKSSLD
jgi:hypothetical protein